MFNDNIDPECCELLIN